MDYSQKAESYFSTKLNCAQSVLAPFGPDLGIDEKTCFRIAEAFGGGIAHSGQMCGAIIGALMVLGLKHGRTETDDLEKRDKTNKLAKILIHKFTLLHKSSNCIELIDYDISTPAKLEKAREEKVFQNCGNLVKDAVNILKDII
ncbi:MAG: C_GCAxxG_C_C family protein [Candidatus Heimdallarchaeota archaeon]|nr:MAG: C_GCAxxG_C_C family protein [Candidatus Heimdallarchaeota archaeon]